MKKLIATCLMIAGLAGVSPAAEPVNVEPVAAATWLAETPVVQIVDVRTKEEFVSGHLADASLIPWTDEDFSERATKELDPAKPVFVYCRSGRRSAAAAAALAKLGFTDIRNLDGGIVAWQKAGKSVTKPE